MGQLFEKGGEEKKKREEGMQKDYKYFFTETESSDKKMYSNI